MIDNTKTTPQSAKPAKAPKRKIPVKDIIIYSILAFLLGLIIYSRLHGQTVDQWGGEFTGIVGDFTIYLLGIIGIFEFSYDNGIMFLVPDKFVCHKEESLRKQTVESLMAFFDEESQYLREHEESRLADTLSIMGLSAQGYQQVQAKVLEARLAPMHDIETARKKLLDLVFYSDVVIDMHRNAEHTQLPQLRFYIKFHDLMHNTMQNDAIARAMATFIAITCKEQGINLSEIDAIMVPHSSNYLLGLTVSKLLGKRFIKMINPEKRIGNYSFEGVIPEKILKKTVDVLIIHDVLLSGKQIYESADSLKETLPNCKIHGLFSAIYRNVMNGKDILERAHGIKCYSLAELTEEEVEQELKKRNKFS